MLSALLAITLASPTAAAQSNEPFMWGVGPAASTVLFPVRYPRSLPSTLPEDFDYPNQRGNGRIDAVGVLHLANMSRLHASMGLGGNAGWLNYGVLLGYDQFVYTQSTFGGFLGFDVGLGRNRFSSQAESADVLEVSTFDLGVKAGATLRDRTRCYEVNLYGRYPFPREHLLNPGQGDEEIIRWGGAWYAQIGIQGVVYFGDFTPPKKKKKKKS